MLRNRLLRRALVAALNGDDTGPIVTVSDNGVGSGIAIEIARSEGAWLSLAGLQRLSSSAVIQAAVSSNAALTEKSSNQFMTSPFVPAR